MAYAYSVLELARYYVRQGLSVVPKMTDKRTTVEWKPYQERIPTDSELVEWFGGKLWEEVGLACVTGAVSGLRENYGLIVMDFDNMAFWEPWCQLTEDMHDRLVISKSGSGKRHVWFRAPGSANGRRLYAAYYPQDNSPTGRSIAIEVSREGTTITLPPSIHPSGNRYEWIQGKSSTIPFVSEFFAIGLLAAAQSLDQAPMTKQQLERAKKMQLKEEMRLLRERENVEQKQSVIEAFNREMHIEDVLERFEYYALPGHPNKYVRPGSVARRLSINIQDGRSYHHSSDDPLADGYWQTPFSVFCKLAHYDDVTNAVKDAARILGL